LVAAAWEAVTVTTPARDSDVLATKAVVTARAVLKGFINDLRANK
jgi:hypothetical protein